MSTPDNNQLIRVNLLRPSSFYPALDKVITSVNVRRDVDGTMWFTLFYKELPATREYPTLYQEFAITEESQVGDFMNILLSNCIGYRFAIKNGHIYIPYITGAVPLGNA